MSGLRVLICGGGNGAHILATLASSRSNLDVRVLTMFENEAKNWSQAIKDHEMTAVLISEDGSVTKIRSSPKLVTDDPSEVVTNANVIFVVAPAYAHESILSAIAPYIQPNTLITGLPGHPGFEMQCLHILRDKARHCIIASFETLPWSCRLTEYGKQVEVLGVKKAVGVFIWNGQECQCSFPVLNTIQNIIGEKSKVKMIENYLVLNLMDKSLLHPPIMYGRWSDWDGEPLKEKTLFYQGVDDRQAALLSMVSDEVVFLAKTVKMFFKDMDVSSVIHLSDWMKEYYAGQMEDDSSLKRSMQTNKAYNGLMHPMKLTESQVYIPDFTHRFMTEDIPFGLVFFKGVAEILDVSTPTIDEIIKWGQGILGKEFIVGSTLTGKDLRDTRAPQCFGIHTKQKLIDLDSILSN